MSLLPRPVPDKASGIIILVGAGPGDPDLLTVAARDAILAADLIVHDGLVDQRILDIAPAKTRISVAKARSRHTTRGARTDKMGTTYAKVLPEPVGADTHTS